MKKGSPTTDKTNSDLAGSNAEAYISRSAEKFLSASKQKAKARRRRSQSHGDLTVSPENIRKQHCETNMKVVYPGQGIYEGSFEGTQRQGFGIFVDDLGGIYRGMWHNDKPGKSLVLALKAFEI
jgi:hypothetical protein